MFGRFTVEVIGHEVADQLFKANPSRRLMHRLFRKGRRDGKKVHDHKSVAALVSYAVDLATSRLCEEYVSRRDAAARDLTQLRADLRKAEADVQALREREALLKDFNTSDGDDATSDLVHDSVLHDSDTDALLRSALIRRRELRSRKRNIARRLNLKENLEELQTELLTAQASVLAAEDAITANVDAAQPLRDQYRERSWAVAQAGGLLWSRYCNGFDQGYTRRRSRGSSVRPPLAQMAFELPPLLRGEGPLAVPSVASDRPMHASEV